MKAKLFRLYNIDLNRYGEPFALCEEHEKVQEIPENCMLIMIAIEAVEECNTCWQESDEGKVMAELIKGFG